MSMNESCPCCKTHDLVIENDLVYARYDNYPVNEGHLLIIRKRHVADYFDTTQEEKLAIMALVEEAQSKLSKNFSPDGFNIGINVGQAAGQTVMHMHLHIIPRYKGDMDDPRGGVRGVIPEKQKY